MNKIILQCIIGLLMLGICSCNYEFSEIKPTYAVPLVNSRLTVYNLMARDSNNLLTSQNGQVTLVYTDSLIELDNFKILRLVNQNVNFDIAYPGPSFNPFGAGQQQTFSGTSEIGYTPATGEELYKIIYRAGQVSIAVNSNIQHNIDLELTFPDLTLNGVPLVYKTTLTYNGGPLSATFQVPLNGYTLDLTEGNTTFNEFRILYKTTIRSAGDFPLSNGDRISFAAGLTAQNYEEVDGYFGQNSFPLAQDSFDIKLFQYTDEGKTNATGKFAFTDPRLKLSVLNGFSIPFNIFFTKLATRQTGTGDETPLLLGNFQNPFSADYPLVPGNVVLTERTVDRTNSNIQSLITPVEKQLLYAATVNSNPNGKTVNKVSRLSRLKVKAELTLPLVGYAYDWILSDTSELGFTASEKEKFNSAILRLNVSNKLPIEVDLQVYFLDDNKNIVDSLLGNGNKFVKSGILDASGRVVEPTNSITDVDVSPAKTNLLFNSRYVAVVARLQTKDGPQQREIRIYDDYFIDVKIGVKAGLNLQP